GSATSLLPSADGDGDCTGRATAVEGRATAVEEAAHRKLNFFREGWMRRREFIAGLGGAAAWPLMARAQQNRSGHGGVLMALLEDDAEGRLYVEALVQGLGALGWAPGRNLRIDTRWGGADRDRIQAYANELVSLKPDVIVGQTSLVIPALQRATSTVP